MGALTPSPRIQPKPSPYDHTKTIIKCHTCLGGQGTKPFWIKVCGVCGSPATEVQHYGSISCYSCRSVSQSSSISFWLLCTTDNHQLKLWSSSGRCVYLLSGLGQCLAEKVVTAPNFSSLSFFIFSAFFRRSVGSGKEYRWINWKPMKLNLGKRVEVDLKFNKI